MTPQAGGAAARAGLGATWRRIRAPAPTDFLPRRGRGCPRSPHPPASLFPAYGAAAFAAEKRRPNPASLLTLPLGDPGPHVYPKGLGALSGTRGYQPSDLRDALPGRLPITKKILFWGSRSGETEREVTKLAKPYKMKPGKDVGLESGVRLTPEWRYSSMAPVILLTAQRGQHCPRLCPADRKLRLREIKW